jgi:hypothetical protein
MNGFTWGRGFKTHIDNRWPVVTGAEPRLSIKLLRIQTPSFAFVPVAEANVAAVVAALDQLCCLATPIAKLGYYVE